MKILCVYFDEEENYLERDPQEVLVGHDVYTAHSYVEALAEILEAMSSKKPFDVVMTDLFLPRSPGEETCACGPIIGMIQEGKMFDALGVFVPEDIKEVGVNHSSMGLFLKLSNCWDIAGRRDWEKMLSTISYGLSQVKNGEFEYSH